MGICTAKELKEVQRQLSAALAKQAAIWGKVDAERVQLSWLHYRNSDCNTFTPDEGGTIYPTLYAECLLDLTIDRLIETRRATAMAQP